MDISNKPVMYITTSSKGCYIYKTGDLYTIKIIGDIHHPTEIRKTFSMDKFFKDDECEIIDTKTYDKFIKTVFLSTLLVFDNCINTNNPDIKSKGAIKVDSITEIELVPNNE